MATFKLADTGKYAYIELDGKTLGPGVTGVEYKKEGKEGAKLTLNIDITDFRFLPDGQFDEHEKIVDEIKSKKAHS